MTSFIAAGGSGRSSSVIPAVPAASSVTTIAFILHLPVSRLSIVPVADTGADPAHAASSAGDDPPPRALARAIAAGARHPREQLARADGLRAALERAGAQVRREVVVVALE